MCGLVGVASGYISLKEQNMFKNLLHMSELRGKHSTGIIAVNRDTETWFKYLGAASGMWSALENKDFEDVNDIVGGFRLMALMGHTRYATKGDLSNIRYAHPHINRNVIGMHNGTIDFDDVAPEGASDSKILYARIARRGITEVLSELREDDSFALQYYDTVQRKVYLVRNKKRELWLAESKDSNTLWWASEAGMLKWAAERNKISIKTPVLLKPEVLLQIDLPKIGKPSLVQKQLKVKYLPAKPPVWVNKKKKWVRNYV